LGELRHLGWKIIIFTTRGDREKIGKYLLEHNIPFDHINENPHQPANAIGGKPIADVYVDDRALQFNGNWSATLKKILNFKSWEERMSEKDDESRRTATFTFLGRDFSDTYSQMRHYDDRIWDIVKFAFGQLLLVASLAWAVYGFGNDPDTKDALRHWGLVIFTLVLISYLFSLLCIATIAVVRTYYVRAAKYVNEHRTFFLNDNVVEFPNASRFYTQEDDPRIFDPKSSQMFAVYFITLVTSVMLGIGLGLMTWQLDDPASPQVPAIAGLIGVIVAIVSCAAIISSVTFYLKREQAKLTK
jgi:hypothetical protein